jgi:hypothetical protein
MNRCVLPELPSVYRTRTENREREKKKSVPYHTIPSFECNNQTKELLLKELEQIAGSN